MDCGAHTADPLASLLSRLLRAACMQIGTPDSSYGATCKGCAVAVTTQRLRLTRHTAVSGHRLSINHKRNTSGHSVDALNLLRMKDIGVPKILPGNPEKSAAIHLFTRTNNSEKKCTL